MIDWLEVLVSAAIIGAAIWLSDALFKASVPDEDYVLRDSPEIRAIEKRFADGSYPNRMRFESAVRRLEVMSR